MNVHDIRNARRVDKTRRTSWGSRLGTLAMGVCFAPLGAAFAWLPLHGLLSRGASPSVTWLLPISVGSFIALFGLSMTWQSVRGAPTSHGFFIRWLAALGPKLSPAGVLLAIHAVGAVALLLGLVLQIQSEVDAGISIISAWLAFHLQILFHEYGHFFAGQICGFAPYRVVGGVLNVSLQGNRWRWRANEDWQFLLGGAVFAETQYARSWSQEFLFVAAGPIATGVLLFVCGQLHGMIGDVPVLSGFLATNATIGFLTLIFNLLPLRFGDMSSDGLQLLQLFKRL